MILSLGQKENVNKTEMIQWQTIIGDFTCQISLKFLLKNLVTISSSLFTMQGRLFKADRFPIFPKKKKTYMQSKIII